MFRPRNHIKLDQLDYLPEVKDLQRALGEAKKSRSSTIELPWRIKDVDFLYSLAVRAEYAHLEPVWTLYEGEGSRSHVIWSAPFTDLDLLKEVISLTVAESTLVSYTSLPAQKQPEEPVLNESYWQAAEEEVREQESLPIVKQNFQPKETVPVNQPPMNPPPVPYGYFYPGYPYPIPYPYPYVYPPPPAVAAPQPIAGTIPLQPGTPATLPTNTLNQLVPLLPQADNELVSKQKNYMLGQLLIDTGVIVPDTLNTILKLQEMISNGLLNTDQAVDAVKKSRNENGAIEVAALIKKLSGSSEKDKDATIKRMTPLLGEILVKAEVINNALLVAMLKLQEVVRSGAMTPAEACQAFKRELAGVPRPQKQASLTLSAKQQEGIVDLLVQAGLLTPIDKETAYLLLKRHGGRIDNILATAGKVSKKTFAAAIECQRLLAQKKLKLEKAMIALNYCERSRVGLTEAIADLGWHDEDL